MKLLKTWIYKILNLWNVQIVTMMKTYEQESLCLRKNNNRTQEYLDWQRNLESHQPLCSSSFSVATGQYLHLDQRHIFERWHLCQLLFKCECTANVKDQLVGQMDWHWIGRLASGFGDDEWKEIGVLRICIQT